MATVTNVSSSSANGTYKIGDVITIVVTFSESVTVNTGAGIPRIVLETGSTDQSAGYVSGSGTDTLTFSYTVQAGDTSADLDYSSTSALELQGGTIKDSTSADATLTLPAPGAAGSLGANKSMPIDGVRPTATVVVADTTLTVGETSLVTVTFSEAVSGFTNADLTVANGSLSAVSSSNGGITWTATLTPSAATTDATNIITLSNAGVMDSAGNAGTGTTDSNNYAVDTVNNAPILTGDRTATVLKGATYQITSADLSFTDSDDAAANVTFTVSSLVNGTVLVNGAAATTFTGAQLAAGNVSFRHTGSGVSPASFNVSVEDGNEDVSAPVAQTFSITVRSAPTVANPVSNQLATEDTAFSFTVPLNAFTDEDGSTLTYTATLTDGSALPSWLKFNATTRTFSGTPLNENVGAIAVKVTASDGISTASDEFSLTVANTNDAPISVALSANSVPEDSLDGTVIGTLSAVDPDTIDTATFSITENGGGEFAISGSQLIVAQGADLNFEEKSSYTITLRVTDKAGAFKDQTFTINVTDLDNEVRGGKGDNVLTGGDAGDWIDGKAGNDKLSGGEGPDIFVFGKNYGRDMIIDFDPTEGDRIDLSDARGINGFKDLMKHHVEDTGRNLVITTDDGSQLVLKNIDPDDLGRDSFIF